MDIFEAVRRGNIARIIELLESGIDVNSVDHWQRTLLHIAADEGHKEVVELLVGREGINVNKSNPLAAAVGNNHLEIARLLLTFPEIDCNITCGSWPLLVTAAANKAWEVVDLLLTKGGIDVNQKNSYGSTLLCYAGLHGKIEIIQTLLSNPDIDLTGALMMSKDINIIQLLIARFESDVANGRASEDQFKRECGEALLRKCLDTPTKYKDIIRLLIDKGALLECSFEGRTTLNHAISPDGDGPMGRMDIDVVKWLIEAGADLYIKDSFGRTPFSMLLMSHSYGVLVMELLVDNVKTEEYKNLLLNESCKYGYTDQVVRLIRDGADVNVQYTDGSTPLLMALEIGYKITRVGFQLFISPEQLMECEPKCLQIIQILIDAGVRGDHQDLKGKTALMIACELGYTKIAQALITRGADVDINLRDLEGNTALIKACRHENKELALMLVSYGASFVAIDDTQNRNTDLFEALITSPLCNDIIFQTLGANSQGARCDEILMLHACQRGYVEVVETLIGRDVPITTNCLIVATIKGHEHIVQLLLEAGATPDLIDDCYRMTALMIACELGHEHIVQLLLEAGATPDLIDNRYHMTALMIACELGHEHIVQLLLEAGATPDLIDDRYYHKTALIIACEKGQEQIARLLIAAGADVGLQDQWGINALLLAYKAGHIEMAKRLINEYGYVVKSDHPLFFMHVWIVGDQAEIAKFIKGNIDAQDEKGRTALMLSSTSDKYEDVVRYLINKSADLDLQDENGDTALLIATSVKGAKNIISLIIDGGATLDTGNFTELMNACQGGWGDTVRVLLKNGANFNKLDAKGESVFDLARYNGAPEVTHMLEVARAAEELLEHLREVESDETYDDIFVSCITNSIMKNQNIEQYNYFKAYCEEYEFGADIKIDQYLFLLAISLGVRYEGRSLSGLDEIEAAELVGLFKKLAFKNGISDYDSVIESLNPDLLPISIIAPITKLMQYHKELFAGIEDSIVTEAETHCALTLPISFLLKDEDHMLAKSRGLTVEEYRDLSDVEKFRILCDDYSIEDFPDLHAYYASHPEEFARSGVYLDRKIEEGMPDISKPWVFAVFNPKKYIFPVKYKAYLEKFAIDMKDALIEESDPSDNSSESESHIEMPDHDDIELSGVTVAVVNEES
jgi:ankyrin repeat protein